MFKYGEIEPILLFEIVSLNQYKTVQAKNYSLFGIKVTRVRGDCSNERISIMWNLIDGNDDIDYS